MILCFHDIGTNNPSKYVLTPNQLKKVLDDHPDADIHFDDGRKGVIEFALPILEQMKRKATVFLVPNFLEGKIPEHENYTKFMTEDDIKILIKHGWEIGSHSYSHSALTMVQQFELNLELVESKKFLEKMFNVKVTKFSYPYGRVDNNILGFVQQIYPKCYTLDSELGIKRALVIDKNGI